LGGGPIGLEMALAATRAGCQVTLVEKGPTLCSNVLRWGHVTLFSPNSMNISNLGRQTMQEMQMSLPEAELFQTGSEYYSQYLKKISDFLFQRDNCEILLNTTVIGVTKGQFFKSDMSSNRRESTYRILTESEKNGEIFENSLENIDVLVDCTGSYGNHNFTGIGGVPALGERSLSNAEISYTIPNVLKDVECQKQWRSRHVLVVGCGASAATCLAMLKKLGNVKLTWVTRRETGVLPYTIIENDPLPQRAELCHLGNNLAAGSSEGFKEFCYLDNSSITSYKKENAKIIVSILNNSTGLSKDLRVDHVIAAVGYRPDTDITRELQIHYCYASEGPMKLAASLLAAGGGNGDCLAQTAAGDETLLSPEKNMFILGMKSYGRSSAFLLRIGHQQVEAVCRLLKLEVK